MEDAREAQRLSGKVDPREWVDQYFQGYIAKASQVLDVGCGSGIIAAEIARRQPAANVVGVDQSEQRLSQSRAEHGGHANLSFEHGLASSLPFTAERFDFAYSRFLLEYLPDRQKAVEEMTRVCRPGGRVVLQDLDGQLVWHYPEDAALRADLERVLAAMVETGFDPFVGRKLFSLAQSAGLTDIGVRVDGYHLYPGRIDAHNEKLWELKLDIALPVAERVLGSREDAERLKTRFMDFLRREDTLTYSILFTVSGVKPDPDSEI